MCMQRERERMNMGALALALPMNVPILPLLQAARKLPSMATEIFPSHPSNLTSANALLQLTETQVIINKKPMQIVQPEDVDAVLEMYISQDRLDSDPYWCCVWPSGIALAEEILRRPELVRGLRVCELGAGLGLGGLAATISGAADVVLYDREPLALLCALVTIHANCSGVVTNLASVLQKCFSQVSFTLPCHIAGLPAETVMSACMKGQKVKLVQPLFKSIAGNYGSIEVHAELFDWTSSERTRPFDVVIASDVLYEKAAIPYLTNAITRLLRKDSKASLLLTDPVHRSPKNREMFLRLLKSSTTPQQEDHPLFCVSRRNLEMEGRLHEVELIFMETGST